MCFLERGSKPLPHQLGSLWSAVSCSARSAAEPRPTNGCPTGATEKKSSSWPLLANERLLSWMLTVVYTLLRSHYPWYVGCSSNTGMLEGVEISMQYCISHRIYCTGNSRNAEACKDARYGQSPTINKQQLCMLMYANAWNKLVCL